MEQESLLSTLKRNRAIQEHILPNGLKVLLCPRPHTKVVCCMIWYHVGSSYESSGETGISHFLEHLMFKGTTQYKKGEIDLLTQIYGGMNNASTHYDFTNYYFNFAADRFEVALEIEANRMKNCLFDEREFQSEKRVVIDELMQGKDSPWNTLDEEVYQIGYRVHPYHRPIIGWKEDLIHIQMDQVQHYYRRFYQPNNATLVLVGDVSEEKTMERVRKLFGSIPSGTLIPEKIPVEPLQMGERRSILELDVNVCRLSMAFHTCVIGHPDDYILDTIDNILSYGKSARLYQKLVEEQQLCRFIYTNNDTNKTAGMYWVLAELMEGASTEKVEKSIQEELERLQQEKVSEAELHKAKNVALAHHIFESESCEALAYAIGLWDNAASYTDYENYLDHIQRITPESICETAKKYFQVTNKNIAISLPRTHPLSIPSQVEPQLEIVEENESSENEDIPSLPTLQMPSLLRSKKTQEFQFRRNRIVLENGLVLLHYYNPQLPIVHLHTFINAGQKYEKTEKAGIASLAGAMLLQGTHQRSGLEIAQSIEDLGSVLESSSGGIACKTLKPYVKPVLEIMNDCLRNPAFPKTELDKERNKMIAELASIEDNCRRKTQQKFTQTIYGNHPFGRHAYGSEATLTGLSQADLQSYHQWLYVPNNAILAVSGDISFEEILSLVRHYFADWNASSLILPELPPIARQTQKQIVRVPMDREQLNIYLGHLGITRNNPDFHKLIVLDYLLGTGTGFTDRMSKKLRDEMGLAYTVYANITDSAGIEPGTFTCFIGTDPRNGETAVQEILNQIRLFKTYPVRPEELEYVQSYLTGSFVFAFERNAQITRHMIQMERYHLSESYLESYFQEILSTTPEEILTLAQKYLDTENYTLVLGGKTDEISLS